MNKFKLLDKIIFKDKENNNKETLGTITMIKAIDLRGLVNEELKPYNVNYIYFINDKEIGYRDDELIKVKVKRGAK